MVALGFVWLGDAVQSAETGDRRVDELLDEIRALREDLRNRRDRETGM